MFNSVVLKAIPQINELNLEVFMNKQKGENVPNLGPLQLLYTEQYVGFQDAVKRALSGNIDFLMNYSSKCTGEQEKIICRKVFFPVLFDEVLSFKFVFNN